jgi:uncharacterized protein YjbI with pentapeptide repeats
MTASLDPFDVEAMEKSVNDSAARVSTIWVSFLVFGLYLVIAAGAVTHRQLMLEVPVKLPVLNIDLPLVGFSILAPVLFSIFHVYVLMLVLLLARTAVAYNEALERSIMVTSDRARIRQRLANTLFAQMFAGSPRERLLGACLWFIAWGTLAIAPVLVLLVFEVEFLPYHSSLVTWIHRIVILCDLLLLWILWPPAAKVKHLSAVFWLVSFATLMLVFCVVTFPGERFHDDLRSMPVVGPLHDWLVAGDYVDRVTRKPTSLFSNVLVLPDLDMAGSESISLRGRRLEGAVLLHANLRNADFTGARLTGAKLSFAELQNANFGCAESAEDVRGSPPTGFFPPLTSQMRCTNLEMALLIGANLEGATLSGANIRGARLDYAHLERAKFECLQWAAKPDETPDCAQLQGAVLHGAYLGGASLGGAHLEGASLSGAHLEGAWLRNAHLQGAWLVDANLQNVCLSYADMDGAWLNRTLLMGAALNKVQLLGARLDDARLDGASLGGVFAWRADVRKARGQGVTVSAPQTGPKVRKGDWTTDSFAGLKRRIEEEVPKGDQRESALKRIANLDPAKPLDGEEEMAKAWVDLARVPPAAPSTSACDR